ncbi:MAG TPA: acyltransferase [Bdellovibrionota bacterium]|nr:acyltransferase [Bdellovibrionota bacterium]
MTHVDRPRSLVGKAWWVLRHRPAAFLRSLRGYSLFVLTHALWRIVHGRSSEIELGKNVRIQRLRCLHAERPNAKIILGDHSIVYEKADVGAYGSGRIEIADCAVLGDIRIAARGGVKIGRRFISSWNVFIQDFDPHPPDPELRGRQVEAICAGFRPRQAVAPYPERFDWAFPASPIEIGDDVWVGANATILKGAKIGSGSIVATGAVVLSGEYPPRSLIGGNPAKVVKTL